MNPVSMAILGFLLAIVAVHLVKPKFVYNQDNSLRDFGVGYRKKTVLPMWVVVTVAAILSYAAAIMY